MESGKQLARQVADNKECVATWQPNYTQAVKALKKMGNDLRDARRQRRISTTTLYRIEKVDSGVSMSSYTAVIFALGLVERLSDSFDARYDAVGLGLRASVCKEDAYDQLIDTATLPDLPPGLREWSLPSIFTAPSSRRIFPVAVDLLLRRAQARPLASAEAVIDIS